MSPVWHRCNRELDVHRRVQTPDGSGGTATSWAHVGTVWAQVSQPTAAERVLAEQAGSRHDHYVHTGPDDDVRRGDRLRDAVADPALVDPDERPYFDVISVIKPSSSGVYRRADCELIQPEGEP